jgi:hypothetical protein
LDFDQAVLVMRLLGLLPFYPEPGRDAAIKNEGTKAVNLARIIFKYLTLGGKAKRSNLLHFLKTLIPAIDENIREDVIVKLTANTIVSMHSMKLKGDSVKIIESLLKSNYGRHHKC